MTPGPIFDGWAICNHSEQIARRSLGRSGAPTFLATRMLLTRAPQSVRTVERRRRCWERRSFIAFVCGRCANSVEVGRPPFLARSSAIRVLLNENALGRKRAGYE